MANLEPSGTRIPGIWPIKLTFSLIVTFALHKLKTELKNLQRSSYIIVLSKVYFMNLNMSVYFRTKFHVSSIIRTSGRQGRQGGRGLCITASGNILASENHCFRVFKLQLKAVNKNFCWISHRESVKQISSLTVIFKTLPDWHCFFT